MGQLALLSRACSSRQPVAPADPYSIQVSSMPVSPQSQSRGCIAISSPLAACNVGCSLTLSRQSLTLYPVQCALYGTTVCLFLTCTFVSICTSRLPSVVCPSLCLIQAHFRALSPGESAPIRIPHKLVTPHKGHVQNRRFKKPRKGFRQREQQDVRPPSNYPRVSDDQHDGTCKRHVCGYEGF